MRAVMALLIAFTAFSVQAAESVKTQAGSLQIEGSLNAPKLSLNGKVISAGESVSYGFYGDSPFNIKGTEVVLVADSVSATCQMYFFVTVPVPPGKPTKTESFGTCDDGPSVKQEGDAIVLRMLEQNGRKKTFKYLKGKVVSSN